MATNVLIIGGGAREHAIAWKLRQASSGLGELCVAPGNAGIADLADVAPLAIPKPTAPEAEIAAFLDAAVTLAKARRADLVVVAPDDPLAFGLVDELQARGIRAFGPTKAAARIESSKAFAKDLMRRARIPFAETAAFDDFEEARAYVESRDGYVVVKADGPSVGKGAIVTSSHDEAVDALRSLMIDDALGASGRRVVIEDKLSGREVSAMAFSDGTHVVHMPFACDHKAIFDGDRGPNTGGMGTYSPPSWLGGDLDDTIRRHVTERALAAMAADGAPFRGALFPGIMVTNEGYRVLEFNARLGDPEAEVLLPRLQSDLLDIMLACTDGTLDQVEVRWRDEAAVCVMMASEGYPGPYEMGREITGLDDVDPDVMVFHAGTKRRGDGVLVTNGGRVLAVTAIGATVAEARAKAYENVGSIRFEGAYWRTDIGAKEDPVAARG